MVGVREETARALHLGETTTRRVLEHCVQQIERHEATIRAWVLTDFPGAEAQKEWLESFGEAFTRVDVPQLMRVMDRFFGDHQHSLASLFRDEQRKVLEARLDRWDLLPPPVQEKLLDDEMTSRYFTQGQMSTNWSIVLSKMSPERRAKLEAGLDRWRKFSEEERQKTIAGFNAFFELTPGEKQKALLNLSETEQRQMEKTLQAYANLPTAQRLQCIQSFEKFTGMSLAERQLFLKNAERWKQMSEAEREAWRHLVSSVPPIPVRVTSPGVSPPAKTNPTMGPER